MTDLPALAASLRAALGSGIGVGVSDPRTASAPLWPEEEAATARMVPRRRREFAAGRQAARAAMADLGEAPAPVPMGADRAPRWPAGLVGSISHTSEAAVALVARATEIAGLGVDIEEDAPLEAALWPEILTPEEQAALFQYPDTYRGRRARAIFSAKEALHKTHHPLTGRMLEFDEVSVTLNGQSLQARLPFVPTPLPQVVTGRLLRASGLIVTVFAPAAGSAPAH